MSLKSNPTGATSGVGILMASVLVMFVLFFMSHDMCCMGFMFHFVIFIDLHILVLNTISISDGIHVV